MTIHRGSLFSFIHAPFVFIGSLLLSALIIKYIFLEINSGFIFVIIIVPFIVLYVLGKFNKRYFFNQKRYLNIIPMKWTDFSMASRIAAYIHILLLSLPVISIVFFLITHIEK